MRRLVVRVQAEQEIASAIDWYKKQNALAADNFAAEIDRVLTSIRENPFQCQAIEGEIRRLVMQPFPYWIVYLITDRDVAVVSCFHTSRDPTIWRDQVR